MNELLLKNLRNHHDIADHAYYFLAACVSKSISGGAESMKTTTKSVFNHIKWLELLIGKPLLELVKPGHTMKLTARGKKLYRALRKNFEEAVITLNLNKVEGIIERSFTDVIKEPGIATRKLSSKEQVAEKKPRVTFEEANNTYGNE